MCRFALLAGMMNLMFGILVPLLFIINLIVIGLTLNIAFPGVVGMRGTIPPSFGLMKYYAEEIASLIKKAGVSDMPVGVDYAEKAMFFALQEAGLNVVDGQQIMLEAREIKNVDEIQLLNQAPVWLMGYTI
ncbi:MAG: hypothetical protein CM15mP117_00050 [Alphaproteobacteria bacterium]|nr:MAG: hypothetical protein CM15mP117_00050 [Alphaproteobacteria bacterium]